MKWSANTLLALVLNNKASQSELMQCKDVQRVVENAEELEWTTWKINAAKELLRILGLHAPTAAAATAPGDQSAAVVSRDDQIEK